MRIVAISTLNVPVEQIGPAEDRAGLNKIHILDIVYFIGELLVAAIDRHTAVECKLTLNIADITRGVGHDRYTVVALVAGLLNGGVTA